MKEKIVWVGPRESDILYSGIDFFRTITYNGSNTGNNVSFTSINETRIDHNQYDAKKLRGFLDEQLLKVLQKHEVKFLFYNTLQAYSLNPKIINRILGANRRELLMFLRSKANMRAFAEKHIPVIPYVAFSGKNIPDVNFLIGKKGEFVLQDVRSSSGHGTFQMSREYCKTFVAERSQTAEYILSPFLENAAPINTHVVIFDKACVVLPASFQLIGRDEERFSYIGGDFHTRFSKETYDLIFQRSMLLGEALRSLGYRGVCGIDFMLTENELYFLEVNARFQASTFLLNKLLKKEAIPSIHQLHLSAFSGEDALIDSIVSFQHPKSFFTIYGSCVPPWLSAQIGTPAGMFDEVLVDGFRLDMKVEKNGYIARAIMNRNICWLDGDFRLRIAPNVQQDPRSWQNKILRGERLCIKIGLLNQGIRISRSAKESLRQNASIRQGVFQSIDLTFPDQMIVNAPYKTDFSEISPFSMDLIDGRFMLFYEATPLFEVKVDAADPYRDLSASHGTIFRNVSLWATDRLRIHHHLSCQFKMDGKACGFCNARIKQGQFAIEDVFEVVDFYLEHAEFRHFLIGGGSGNIDDEYENILLLVRHIRKRSQKPIYVMCLPPKTSSVLTELHSAGVDEIGFNLELFDRDVAHRIMPGKGAIPLSQYEYAYRTAVNLWGKSGNVRSLLVLGLERMESFFQGVEWLSKMGVMPIISIFRPLDNIIINEALPINNENLEDIYYRAKEITAKYGLIPGPFCTACQNNTLSLPMPKDI